MIAIKRTGCKLLLTRSLLSSQPENVLFDKDGHVCLTDFGISKEIGEDKTKVRPRLIMMMGVQ